VMLTDALILSQPTAAQCLRWSAPSLVVFLHLALRAIFVQRRTSVAFGAKQT
jgi:hypothetical protein